MAQAKQGDKVKVNYTGKLRDGTVFDSTEGRQPLQFTIGEGQIIPDFEQAVLGMTPGDSITITTPPERAYGPHDDRMVVEVNRDLVPPEVEPEVGMQLQMRQDDGMVVPVTITDVSESAIVLDANHPLAGKDLVFDIELVDVEQSI